MSATQVMEPIQARRMGRFARPGDFHRPLPLLPLGPSLPRAACKGQGNLWDGTIAGETKGQRAQRVIDAAAICGGCPEQRDCREWRRANGWLGEGVWGGQLFGESTQRLCGCGCGQPLPADAHPLRRYYTRACRQRMYLAQPAKKAARRARRKAAA